MIVTAARELGQVGKREREGGRKEGREKLVADISRLVSAL